MIHTILSTAPPPVIVTGGGTGSPLDGTAWVVIITTAITAVTTAVVTIINALANMRNNKVVVAGVTDVRNEVKTMNELTMGQLAERGETRRIEGKPSDEWTAQESRHVEQSAEREGTRDHSTGETIPDHPQDPALGDWRPEGLEPGSGPPKL